MNADLVQIRSLLDAGQAEKALVILQSLQGKGQDAIDLLYAEALADLGRVTDAQHIFSGLLSAPDDWLANPQPALTYALACQTNGQPKKAVDILLVLSGQIDAPVIWQSLSSAALECSDFPLAWQANARLLAQNPTDAGLWHQAGLIRQEQDMLDEAIGFYNKAVALNPGQADSWNNLANCLSDTCQVDAADTAFANAMILSPDNADFLCNQGKHAWVCGRFEQAVTFFTRALDLSRDGHDAARLGLACAKLAIDPDRSAWCAFESRFQVTTPLPYMQMPRWQGEKLDGKHVVIWGEQGFGDALQFSRFLPVLKEMAGKVTFCLPAGLHRLLQRQAWMRDIDLALVDDLPDADCWVPLLSLPVLLDIPPEMRISLPDVSLQPIWPPRRVGFVWQGNPDHNNDHHRSMSLSALEPLGALPDITCISVQYPVPGELPNGWVNGLAGIRDFDDTARVLATLDLVVSVDTATAHLAASMGLPVALMVACGPDWRWGTEGRRVSWYESLRVFRQKRPGDWSDPVKSLRDVIKGGRFFADSA